MTPFQTAMKRAKLSPQFGIREERTTDVYQSQIAIDLEDSQGVFSKQVVVHQPHNKILSESPQ